MSRYVIPYGPLPGLKPGCCTDKAPDPNPGFWRSFRMATRWTCSECGTKYELHELMITETNFWMQVSDWQK